MLKKVFFLGIISGILSGIASLIYAHLYKLTLGIDFSIIVSITGIFSSSIFGCILAALGYWLFDKWFKSNGEIIFNLLFTIISIISIAGPFAAKLPLDLEMPELFPCLTVPMHFFPVLAWFTLKPFFFRNQRIS